MCSKEFHDIPALKVVVCMACCNSPIHIHMKHAAITAHKTGRDAGGLGKYNGL